MIHNRYEQSSHFPVAQFSTKHQDPCPLCTWDPQSFPWEMFAWFVTPSEPIPCCTLVSELILEPKTTNIPLTIFNPKKMQTCRTHPETYSQKMWGTIKPFRIIKDYEDIWRFILRSVLKIHVSFLHLSTSNGFYYHGHGFALQVVYCGITPAPPMPALLKSAGDAALLPSRFEKSAQHAVKRLQQQGFEARMSRNSPVSVGAEFEESSALKSQKIDMGGYEKIWFDMR